MLFGFSSFYHFHFCSIIKKIIRRSNCSYPHFVFLFFVSPSFTLSANFDTWYRRKDWAIPRIFSNLEFLLFDIIGRKDFFSHPSSPSAVAAVRFEHERCVPRHCNNYRPKAHFSSLSISTQPDNRHREVIRAPASKMSATLIATRAILGSL